jgi:hypothetical protein
VRQALRAELERCAVALDEAHVQWALEGCTFVDSPLGEIPERWEVKTVEDSDILSAVPAPGAERVTGLLQAAQPGVDRRITDGAHQGSGAVTPRKTGGTDPG